MIGGQRQFIASARRRPADGAQILLPEAALASSMELRVSLVNLQKLTLWVCGEPASMRMLAPAQNTRSLPDLSTTTFTSGCSKRSRCDGVGELDVDTQIVGVELELIAFEQAGVLVDVHDQLGNLAIESELPVAIARRLGLEIDACWHGPPPPGPRRKLSAARKLRHPQPVDMHYYSVTVYDDA